MAHHLSAKKRIGTNKKANLRNRQYRTMMRTVLRKVRESVTPEARVQNFALAVSTLDSLVHKGIIHRNNAARKKSNLYRLITKAAPAA